MPSRIRRWSRPPSSPPTQPGPHPGRRRLRRHRRPGRGPPAPVAGRRARWRRKGGRNPDYHEADGQRVMKQAEISVRIALGRGPGRRHGLHLRLLARVRQHQRRLPLLNGLRGHAGPPDGAPPCAGTALERGITTVTASSSSPPSSPAPSACWPSWKPICRPPARYRLERPRVPLAQAAVRAAGWTPCATWRASTWTTCSTSSARRTSSTATRCSSWTRSRPTMC